METQGAYQSESESVRGASHDSQSPLKQTSEGYGTFLSADPYDFSPDGANLPSVDAPEPHTETEGKFIKDGGDAKQLEITASISRKGSFLSSEEAPNFSIDHSQHEIQGVDPPLNKTLEGQLRDAFVESMWPPFDLDEGKSRDHYEDFLPWDKLDQIINRHSAWRELRSLGICQDSELNQMVREIWKWSSFPKPGGNELPNERSGKPTTRRKLFAILVLMQQVPTILQLIEEGMYDRHLPFTFNGNKQLHWHKGNTPILISSFKDWSQRDLDCFKIYQWLMLAPYLDLDEKNPTVPHYILHPKIRLPFIKIKETTTEDSRGGFGEVRKISVHPAHHPHGDHNTCKENFFAIKTLFTGDPTKLEAERQALLRVMDERNPHLIRLLLTIDHGGRFSLMFPWATGNLLQFWKRQDPNSYFPSGKLGLIQWIAKQFSGLLGGLHLIHSPHIKQDNAHGLAPDRGPIYGRHGDLKPENILWFEGEGDQRILKIADFGLANFRSKNSYFARAFDTAMSPTYRAPEFEGKKVGPRSDLWSLGCILLEFLVWYHGGWKEVEEFSQNRMSEEAPNQDLVEDKFFIHYSTQSSSTGSSSTLGHGLGTNLKNTVRNEISRLRDDKNCGDFVLDALNFIEDRLLQVRPESRAKAKEVYDKFMELNKKCCDNPDYCMKRTGSLTKNDTPDPPPTNDERSMSEQDPVESIPQARGRWSTYLWNASWQQVCQKIKKGIGILCCWEDLSLS